MIPPVTLLWGAAIVLVGIKALATLVLLRRPPAERTADRLGRWLWWSTKITPILAVPCLIAVARIEHDPGGFWGYSLLMVFVLVAVPIMVWRRFTHAR